MRKRILLVENEESSRFLREKEDGDEILTARNGKAVDQPSEKGKPDVIIPDNVLPKMNGIKALERMIVGNRIQHEGGEYGN